MKRLRTALFFICFVTLSGLAQTVNLDGYVFEEFNRGFLNEVKITVLEKSGVLIGETMTDVDGHFMYSIEPNKEYVLQYEKKVFVTSYDTISTTGKSAGDKVFIKRQMERQPGYLLEVTLAEKRTSDEIPVDAVNGSRIEIYNLTTKKEELVIDSAKSPVFSQTLQQGNHYIIMVRKQGFYNKRLEARVNVEGCYLCMEGFGTVNPGVVDNLTSAKNNALGTLLANVELERINTKKNIKINNIYYAYNSADLTEESKKELDKLTSILQNNPSLIVELGSHTDSRGSEESNLKLSQARAQSAVDYILNSGLIDRNRLKARGYGESQLTNKCADGTPCSESEHLQNRRTELKILGFGDDPYAGLSLAQIISREQSLKMLKAGEFDKEFKVSDNGQMVATPQPQPVKPEPKPQPKPVNPPKTSVKTEPIAMKTDNFDENAPINKPSQQVNSEKTQPTKVATPSVEKPKQGENIIKTDDFDEKLPPKSAERRPNIDLDKAVGGTLKVNLQPVGNFSGYKIEIFKSLTALPADDPDMKMIALEIASDIYFEKTNNGIAYLVGNIQSYSEAEHFLNKILEKYPKARMVEFFNGKRIGE